MKAGSGTLPGTWLYVGVLVALGSGLAVVAVGPWRVGIGICGGSMLLAAAGRLLIPDAKAGLLRVRRRGSDAALMMLVGVALVALALVIPPQPGGQERGDPRVGSYARLP